MKIYIMSDLEGVAGVAVDHQIMPSTHPAYLKACRWMTREVNAAIEGAVAAGLARARSGSPPVPSRGCSR